MDASADNELIGCWPNGVSISRICIPLGVIAVGCTALSLAHRAGCAGGAGKLRYHFRSSHAKPNGAL
jgi:hypothetical protein